MKKVLRLSLFLFITLAVDQTVDAAINLAAQKNPLGKTEWMIESYGAADDQQAVETISNEDNHFPSIKFNAGRTSGYIAGCNSIQFTYIVRKRKFSVKVKSSTMKACADDLMKQDRELSSALEKSESFKISGDNLEINYDNGKIMRLKRSVQ